MRDKIAFAICHPKHSSSFNMLAGLPKELVPVLIGGAIGILGTFAAWVGAYIIYRAGTSETRRDAKRGKIERLVLLGYETYGQMQPYLSIADRAKFPKVPLTVTDEMRMIAALFFPVAMPVVNQIRNIEANFQMWANEQAYKRVFGPPETPQQNTGTSDKIPPAHPEFVKFLGQMSAAVMTLELIAREELTLSRWRRYWVRNRRRRVQKKKENARLRSRVESNDASESSNQN